MGAGGAEDEAGDEVEGGGGGERGAVDGGEAVAEQDGAAAVGRAVDDEVGDVNAVAGVEVEEDACGAGGGG